jgi:NhaA family Na+:H+ antiporter
VLLLTLAVADDIGAIVVIAVVYSDGVRLTWLVLAVAGVVTIVALRRREVGSVTAYAGLAAGVWLATLASGVHPTIAGVALGLLVPGRARIERLHHRLDPWAALVVLPVFALANAGVPLSLHAIAAVGTSRLGLGIVSGLVLGKAVGITGAILLAVHLGIGALPEGVDRRHVVGMSALAGIGFTVSIFVTGLALDPGRPADTATLAVLMASIVSGLLGVAVLRRGRRA